MGLKRNSCFCFKIGFSTGAPMWGNLGAAGRGKKVPQQQQISRQHIQSNAQQQSTANIVGTNVQQSPQDFVQISTRFRQIESQNKGGGESSGIPIQTTPQQIAQQQLVTIRNANNTTNKISILKKPPNISVVTIQKQALQTALQNKNPLATLAVRKATKSLVSSEYNESDDNSNPTPPISPSTSKRPVIKKTIMNPTIKIFKTSQSSSDEVVVIEDSSPDDKQKILHYDDDSDKIKFHTEISLNSTAQNVTDADEIMESLKTSELMSSPLVDPTIESIESVTTAEGYGLFDSSEIVQFSDSNDSFQLTETIIVQKTPTDNIHENPQSSTIKKLEKKQVNQMKKPNNRVATTAEDFEAMIDSGSPPSDGIDEKTETKLNEHKEISKKVCDESNISSEMKDVTITLVQQHAESAAVDTPSEPKKLNQILTTTATSMQQARANTNLTSPSPSAITTHKKLVKNAPQTTAKVSFGNTTISVPVLKNVPKSNELQLKQKKIITSSTINLSNLKKNPALFNMATGQKINTSTPTIVTLSSISLGSNINQALLSKALSRPLTTVQAVHRIPIVTQQSQQQNATSLVKTLVASDANQSILVPISKNLTSISPSIVKMSQPTTNLSFSKISTLTLSQDTSLPTKIFEDESISPDPAENVSSVENVEIPETEKMEKSLDSGKTEKGQEIPSNAVGNEKQEGSGGDGEVKSKSLIPVHVIIKSRESSESPPVMGQQQQRVKNTMISQLSPLSQPTDINTNTANATQQIRSIMSSINKKDDSNKDPNKKEETIAENIQTLQAPTGNLIKGTQHIGRISPNIINTQGGNILVVKQIRASTSSVPGGSSVNSTGDNQQKQTFVVVSQSQINQEKSVIIPNASGTRIISYGSATSNTSDIQNKSSNFTQPATIIMTSRPGPGVISSSVNVVSQASTVLSSQPSVSLANKSSPVQFTNLINLNTFKRSKSTDDAQVAKDSTQQITVSALQSSKRLSLEGSNNSFKVETIESATSNSSKSEEMIISQAISSTGKFCKFSLKNYI